MRLSAVVSDVHPLDVVPLEARDGDRALVAAVRGRLDGITLVHGWHTPRWNPDALTAASYLSVDAFPLGATVRGLPLGVVNPVEFAEQLATLDHAWQGRFRAGLTVGSPSAFAAHGLDVAGGWSRFEEALRLVRLMWTEQRLAGRAAHFVFDEVQPTLRPAQPTGPPLSLEVDDERDIVRAVRTGLGIHLSEEVGPVRRSELLAAYRSGGGQGEVSAQVDLAGATTETLHALADEGVDQVDVQLRHPAMARDALLGAIDLLAERLQSVGGA